jgi:outer membrane protein TolC
LNNNWGNSGKWPTITAGLSNTESLINLDQKLSNGTETVRNGTTQNSTNANLTASWRIYNGMKVRATKARFEELEKIGVINLQQQIAVITFNVLTIYYDIVRFKQQVVALQAIIDLSRERLKIAETRFNVGSAAKTDMLQAQTDLNEQEIALFNIGKQIDQAKATLNNLLKRDPEQALDTKDTTFSVRTIKLGDFVSKLDSQNYDLLRAQRDRQRLIEEHRIINSQLLPTIALNSTTSFNRTMASAGLFLTNQTYGPNIGVAIGIPIYNSNIYKTQLRVNEVQQKQQVVQTELLKSQLQRDLYIAFREYQDALQTLEKEKLNVKSAEENNFIATERFKKLQGNSIELRQAQLSLVDARDKLINAEFRAKVAETSIELIAGEVGVY